MSRSALFFCLALLLLTVATATADSPPNVAANGIMHGLPRALRTFIKHIPDTLFGWPIVVKKKKTEEEEEEEEEEAAKEGGEEDEEGQEEPIKVVVVVEAKKEEEKEEGKDDKKEDEKKETNADVLKKLIEAKSLVLLKGL